MKYKWISITLAQTIEFCLLRVCIIPQATKRVYCTRHFCFKFYILRSRHVSSPYITVPSCITTIYYGPAMYHHHILRSRHVSPPYITVPPCIITIYYGPAMYHHHILRSRHVSSPYITVPPCITTIYYYVNNISMDQRSRSRST